MRPYRLLEGNDALQSMAHAFIQPREADRVEWELASGLPRKYIPMMVEHYMRESSVLWAAWDDTGRPLVIAGVTSTSLLDTEGVPWMIGADFVNDYSFAFLRQSRRLIKQALSVHPKLCNYVHAENHSAIVWLRWLGFQVDEKPVEYGPLRAPFHRFSLEA